MTLRFMGGALATVVLIGNVLTVAPALAQARDATLLPPEEGGLVTVAGCLQRGGKDGDKYVLTNPRIGPVANTPEATCSATINARSLELEETSDPGINESMLGRWIEINGRLERETSTDPDNLRELSVRSFRMVPVVPRFAEAAPLPPPRAQSEPSLPPPAPAAAPEQPVPTTGTIASLPETASAVPLIGLVGLLSLAGAIGSRVYRGYRRG